MSILLDNDFVIISLKNNIIYITLKKKLPSESKLNIIKKTLQKFYDLCNEKNTKFFHIFNFNDVALSSIPNFISTKELIKEFFIKNYKLFRTNLYCTSIILDNFIVRNCISLVLQIYTPSKPLNFVSSEQECHDFFNKIKEEYKKGKWTFEYDESKTSGWVDYNKINYNGD